MVANGTAITIQFNYTPVPCGPTLRAVDAAGAAPGLGAIYAAVPCPRSCQFMKLASGAPDALRWAARSPTHGAEPSGQPERSRITTYHWG